MLHIRSTTSQTRTAEVGSAPPGTLACKNPFHLLKKKPKKQKSQSAITCRLFPRRVTAAHTQAGQSSGNIICQSRSSGFTAERLIRQAGRMRPGRLRDEEREQRVGWEGGETRREEGETERTLTLPTEVAAAVFSVRLRQSG